LLELEFTSIAWGRGGWDLVLDSNQNVWFQTRAPDETTSNYRLVGAVGAAYFERMGALIPAAKGAPTTNGGLDCYDCGVASAFLYRAPGNPESRVLLSRGGEVATRPVASASDALAGWLVAIQRDVRRDGVVLR